MPVRLTKPYEGQPVNTLYWASTTIENALRSTSNADDQIELASDYSPWARTVTGAAATASRSAVIYRMNSGSAQALTIPLSGFWPVGTVLTIEQNGAGATTVAGATGVTINTALSSLVTKGVNNVGQLIKDDVNTWTAVGGFGG